MTLWVSRDGQTVAIHGNTNLTAKIEGSKVSEFAVTEHAAHLRYFHTQLGSMLDEAEAEASDNA